MSLTKKERFIREFAANLRAARERTGLSQAQVAKAAKMVPKQYSHYETEKSIPSLKRFRDLVDALGCKADTLLP